jgi:hypothetical protein
MTRMCTDEADEEEENPNFQASVFSVKSVVQSCIGRVLSV